MLHSSNMRSNVGKLILFFGLLAALAGVYFLQRSNESPEIDVALFRVADPAEIDRVAFQPSGKPEIDLKFDGRRWKVDGKYDADNGLIDVLFAALAQATPRRPVSESLKDSLNRRLKRDGVMVRLYKGDDVKKEFLVGGLRGDTYFRDQEGQSFLMTIPGYRVYLADIFAIDAFGWRDKRVFDLAWRNFRTVSVQFPQDPSSNVMIRRPNLNLTVELEGVADPDTSRVNAYLDDLQSLTCDRIVSDKAPFDSLVKTKPTVTIAVADIAERTYKLELFPVGPGDNQVLGRTENDLMLFDKRKLFRIVKKRTYFARRSR